MRPQISEMVDFFSGILDQIKIPYVIIGGVASATFGRARLTKDVDFVVSIRPEEIAILLDAIEASGFPIDRRNLLEEKISKNGVGKIIWTQRKYSVDFRAAMFHLDEEAIANSEKLNLFGRKICFAPPEDLIVYKLSRFDETDRGDVIGILKAQGDSLNWKRIKRLAKEFALETGIPAIIDNLETVKSWIRE